MLKRYYENNSNSNLISKKKKKKSLHNRDRNIYIHNNTLTCLLKGCIPCLYKVFPGGYEHFLDIYNNISSNNNVLEYNINYPVNQRPETCLRYNIDIYNNINSKLSYNNKYNSSKNSNDQKPTSMINSYDGLYFRGDGSWEKTIAAYNEYYNGNITDNCCNILTVGDGDFSFSLSLAEQITIKNKDRKTLSLEQSTGTLVATSHESHDSVINTYQPAAVGTLRRLKELGVTVLHEVDGMNLTTESRLLDILNNNKFNIVIWNFPCVSVGCGADGQTNELESNKQLLKEFFTNVRGLLYDEVGEVHISHKTVEPFSWWDIKSIAKEAGFNCYYTIVFDRCNYPGYINRKALDRKSFTCNDAQVYVFALAPASNSDSTDKNTIVNNSNNNNNSGNESAALIRLKVLLDCGVLHPLQDNKVLQSILATIKNHSSS